MDIGRWAIRNRAVVATALLVAIVGGLVAASTLPSGIYPEVDFPRIVVVARGGDAPPDVFITSVTRPLEEALVTVLGVRRVRSRTIRGSTEIGLQFVAGTDMWRALQLVESRVNEARGALPPGTEVEVERLTPTAFPIVTFNLSGPLDPRALHDIGEFVVRPALARVAGVGQVRVLGGDVREIEVELDPVRAAAHRLRPNDVATRIRNEVPFQAVGRFDRDRQLVTVLASAEAHGVEEIGSVPVTVAASGTPVPLSDIATVREGWVDRTVRVGGPRGETVLLSVSRLEGASTPDVVHGVEAVARDLARSFPRGVIIEPVYDQARLVTESIASVRDAIIVGIVLCLLVLGVSLRNARAGFIAALTVPATLAITFLSMKAFHQTINLMSLGGMAVAIGLVIDDAIVVIEAIARRLERHENPHDAAANGTRDMAPAVIGTTITTVIVFVPLAFVSGLVGDFFAALAITLSSAVVISLFVALIAVPALAGGALRATPNATRASRLERLYGAVANWGARHRIVGPLLLAVSIAAGIACARAMESGFLPEMDEGAFVMDYFLPAGTSLTETDAAARRIEHVLASQPEIETFSRRTGAELGPIAATQINRGDIMVRLVPGNRRHASASEVIARVRDRVQRAVPEARTEFVQVLQDVLNDLAGAPRPIEIKLFGDRYDRLADLSTQVVSRIGNVPGLVDLYSGVEAPAPSLVFRVDRDAAARTGRTPQDVADELQSVLAGVPAGFIRRGDRLVGIRVRYPDAVRFDPNAVLELPLLVGDHDTVSIAALARPRPELAPSVLTHEGLQPVVIVTADHESRDLGSVMTDVRARLAGLHLPPGFRIEIGGQSESQRDTFVNLGAVLAFGLVLTLLVLVAQFRRIRPAIAVLLTTPFAITGALVTLWATHTPLNASSLMGCVLLVGLEVKSGILLLEVAEEFAASGMSYPEALAHAGERRIRPIMLTTTATMFGVLPLALGIGAGAELQRPLAIAVLGGIALSKFFNLIALPSLAVLFAGRHATHERPSVAPEA